MISLPRKLNTTAAILSMVLSLFSTFHSLDISEWHFPLNPTRILLKGKSIHLVSYCISIMRALNYSTGYEAHVPVHRRQAIILFVKIAYSIFILLRKACVHRLELNKLPIARALSCISHIIRVLMLSALLKSFYSIWTKFSNEPINKLFRDDVSIRSVRLRSFSVNVSMDTICTIVKSYEIINGIELRRQRVDKTI